MAEAKKDKEKYSVGEIATETGVAPIDNETGQPISQLDLLVRIANDLETIKKNIVG